MTHPTSAQRLWCAVFRCPERQAPPLDEGKVLSLVERLTAVERLVLQLFYGFHSPLRQAPRGVGAGKDTAPLTLTEIGRRLRRADGQLGMRRQRVHTIREQALRRLRHSSLRRGWQEAIKR